MSGKLPLIHTQCLAQISDTIGDLEPEGLLVRLRQQAFGSKALAVARYSPRSGNLIVRIVHGFLPDE
jgi:hypothetical protein